VAVASAAEADHAASRSSVHLRSEAAHTPFYHNAPTIFSQTRYGNRTKSGKSFLIGFTEYSLNVALAIKNYNNTLLHLCIRQSIIFLNLF